MSNFHFLKKIWIPVLTLFSCGNSLERSDKQKNFAEIYQTYRNENSFYPTDRVKATLLHWEFLQACQNDAVFDKFTAKFVDKKDILSCVNLKNYVNCAVNKDKCSYFPSSISDQAVKDVYLIFLVPGFFIRSIDPYTPMIAEILTQHLRKKYSNCVVRSDIISRWPGFVPDCDDNNDFQTMYSAMKAQIESILKSFKKKYPHAKFHLNFICESYGGKVTLFFLNKYLKETPKIKNVVFDRFITVHSPLYGMKLAQYMIANKENLMNLYSNTAFSLLLSFLQIDFLNVLNVDHYEETFKLLSEDEIEGVSTDEALKYLVDNNIKILNFIGTPNDVVMSGCKVDYNTIIEILGVIKGLFFDKEGQFMEEKWNTFDHTLTTISEIIFTLKNEDFFKQLVGNMMKQGNPVVNNILICQAPDQIKAILINMTAYFLNEQTFNNLGIPAAVKELANILNNLETLLKTIIWDSDLVVGVDEITRNQNLIDEIKNSRGSGRSFATSVKTTGGGTIAYIISLNLYHACDAAKMSEFCGDLFTFFLPYLERG